MYPYFHIRLSTKTKTNHASIAYGDIMLPHCSLQWAVNKVNNEIQLQSVKSTLRFEIDRHLLLNSKVPSQARLDKMSREWGEYPCWRGNARDRFVLIKRPFHFDKDKISVRTDNAKYPEEHIKQLIQSSERMFCFDFRVPTPHQRIVREGHELPLVDHGKSFCYQRYRPRARAHIEDYAIQGFQTCFAQLQSVHVWRVILTSEAACRCGVLRAMPRTYNEFNE